MDGSGPSTSAAAVAAPRKASRRPKYTRFTQQDLPACRPVLTPGWVISAFMLIGIIFIPIGVSCLLASRSVVEIVKQYETECIPEEYWSNKLAYIQSDSTSKNCRRILRVPKHMKAPIYVYYQLDNFYQNHRRYVKSRSDKELLLGLKTKAKDRTDCVPEGYSNGLRIVPCGLIAWSLFNDTYKFFF